MVTTVHNNPFSPRVGGDTPTNNKDTLEQNRVDLLRILLNGKVKCSHCGHEFRSGTMDKLSFTEWTMTHTPDKLMVTLYCGPCGHEGPFNMKPNPFMNPEKIDAYETLVSMQRKMKSKFPHSPPIIGEGQGWNEDENEEKDRWERLPPIVKEEELEDRISQLRSAINDNNNSIEKEK